MSSSTPGPEPLPSGVLTVGSVSLNPTQEFEIFRPFARFLATRLHDVGIGKGRVVVVDSLSRMAAEIDRGNVDLYVDSPFPASFVCDRSGASPVLRRWKRGSDVYQSVVFTRADSGISSVDDLKGRILAFGEPFSTSGFLMPKAALSHSGLQLFRYEDVAATIPPDEVGYVFSNDVENTVFWVLKGKVAAGAANKDYFLAIAGSRLSELRIIHETERVPRNVVCVRDGLDRQIAKAVEEVLLSMEDDGEGRAALEAFEATIRFDRFPGGTQLHLGPVAALMPYVEEDLGQ
jgi:phosphonate transport system substrate-binding protein